MHQALAHPERTSPRLSVIGFKPHRAGTLLGFVDVHIPHFRLKVFSCTVHQHQNGRRWVSFPGRPSLDHNRELVRDPRGKIQYGKVIEWDGDHIRDAFSDAVLEALQAYDRTAFDGAGE